MFTRLKALGGNLVVYGIGDAATQIISFFLLPIYVRAPDAKIRSVA